MLLRTGWSRRTDPKAFLNVAADGPHSPGFHADASRLLAHDRDVLGVGVETIGTDAGQAGTFDPPFPNHTIMHGAGKFGLASLCNLDQLPPTGAIVIAAPLKIVDGSGSPLRVLALVPASGSRCCTAFQKNAEHENVSDRAQSDFVFFVAFVSS